MKNLISKTTIIESTTKNAKGFEKDLHEMLKRNGIYIESLRYKNFRVKRTPSKKFPEMITLTKCISELKSFKGKRFVNLSKVMVFIDYQMSLITIEKGRKIVESQLNSVVLGEINW